MSNSTRRTFLAVTGASAAVAATATVAAPAVASPYSSAPASTASSPGGSIVAYIADGATGDISLMAGEREVVVHDPELVARLHAHLH